MTREELMKEMVAGFEQDCKEIWDAVLSAEAGKVLSPEVEFEIRRKALRRYAQMLQGEVRLRGKQETRTLAPACSCGEKMRMIRQMPRTVMSILGELRFTRRHYYCDHCRRSRWQWSQ